jgi:hypothetical protein
MFKMENQLVVPVKYVLLLPLQQAKYISFTPSLRKEFLGLGVPDKPSESVKLAIAQTQRTSLDFSDTPSSKKFYLLVPMFIPYILPVSAGLI